MNGNSGIMLQLNLDSEHTKSHTDLETHSASAFGQGE